MFKVVIKMIVYTYLENPVYHLFRQLWLVLGVKWMEINSNWFSRYFEIQPLTTSNVIPSLENLSPPFKSEALWRIGWMFVVTFLRKVDFEEVNSQRFFQWKNLKLRH